MNLSISTTLQGNLYPSVYNCLHSLPDCALHHLEHGKRHPIGIYSLTLNRLLKAFKGVLDENDKIYQVPVSSNGPCNFETVALLEAQQELLDALMAHIDDCYQILKVLYPMSKNPSAKPELFANKWLFQAKHPTVKRFKSQIDPYRATFAPIDNKLKHDHGRLRSLVVCQPNSLDIPRRRIAGYFVEGADGQEALGPDQDIHEGAYAISFHHDLRHHFVHLYTTDHFLAQALVDVIRHEYVHDYEPERYVSVSPDEREKIKNIAERIANLPFLFYSNEVTKPIPSVKFLSAGKDNTLLLENVIFRWLPSLYASTLNPFQAVVQYEGDSVTRSWTLPYMGTRMETSVNKRGEILEVRVVKEKKLGVR